MSQLRYDPHIMECGEELKRSRAILDYFVDYLDAKGIDRYVDESRCAVVCRFDAGMFPVSMYAMVSDGRVLVTCRPDADVPDSRKSAVLSALNAMNRDIVFGHFVLDGDMVVYRHFHDCREFPIGAEHAGNMMGAAVRIMQTYGQDIADAIGGCPYE